jgi:hypothetical protein
VIEHQVEADFVAGSDVRGVAHVGQRQLHDHRLGHYAVEGFVLDEESAPAVGAGQDFGAAVFVDFHRRWKRFAEAGRQRQQEQQSSGEEKSGTAGGHLRK